MAETTPEWEFTAVLEEGVSLTTGKAWRGHRIRYREAGSRRWRSFLLSVDGNETPSVELILRAIAAHAEKG